MDKLQVIQAAEEKGGKARREQIEKLMVYARERGCNIEAGGGRIGGINIRFGGIGYAIMDLSTEGDVKLYVQPHPNKDAPDALKERINAFLKEHEDKLPLKSKSINCHGTLAKKVEEIDDIAYLVDYLEMALQAIRDTYYS